MTTINILNQEYDNANDDRSEFSDSTYLQPTS